MMPVMESLSAFGLIDLRSATYSNPKFMKGLNKITGDQEEILKLQDINFEYGIADGTLIIEPFDFKLAGKDYDRLWFKWDFRYPVEYGLYPGDRS